MLKILIIDDEKPARNRLRRMLAANVTANADVEVVGEAGSGGEALQLILDEKPDVLLLDISMPGMDGMALARLLQKQELQKHQSRPAVIFCTAWSDQAVDAFECDAVDYLVKPVRAERLAAALDKARRFTAKNEAAGNEVFLRSILGSKVKLLPMSEVCCFYSEDKYTTVVHDNGKLVIDQPLLELEKEHSDILLRVHRGALVVKSRIRGLEKTADSRHLVVLEGSEDRPQVSRRNLPSIRKLIKDLTGRDLA